MIRNGLSSTKTRALGLSAILILGSWGNGCGWTPKVETQIYEGEKGSISFITVSEQSFKASHPVNVNPGTLARVFRGIYITHPAGLLQTLLAGKEKPKRVFSEQQVEFLTSYLVTAFSQITPEEQITFQVQVSDPSSPNWGNIKGNMAFHGTDLYLSLRYPSVDTPTTMFFPSEAIRADPTFYRFLGQTGDHGLVINFELLTRLPVLSDPMEEPTADPFKKEAGVGSHPMDPMRPTRSAPGSGAPPAQFSEDSRTGEGTDSQTLADEMRALRKELEAQKAEIQRLKSQKGESH